MTPTFRNPDLIGCARLVARNVTVKSSNGKGFSILGPQLCNIIEWSNVRWSDGRAIPRPS